MAEIIDVTEAELRVMGYSDLKARCKDVTDLQRSMVRQRQRQLREP